MVEALIVDVLHELSVLFCREHVGLERKSIVKYKLGQSSPKLDVMAAIFAYFGESTIHISLMDHTEV